MELEAKQEIRDKVAERMKKIIFIPDDIEKEKLSNICNEVIDLLYKKHKLDKAEIAFVLDKLQQSFYDVVSEDE